MFLDFLNSIPVLLGSQSPRRKELLASMGVQFDVQVRETDERVNLDLSPAARVEDIASRKLAAFAGDQYVDTLVIVADTLVVDTGGNMLGKPQNADDAYDMISRLLGGPHNVITAVGLAYQGQSLIFSETTSVAFAPLEKEEILYYIERYQPFDKAGAYGIQEWIGRVGISQISGSYENVVGLPTARLYKELKSFVLLTRNRV